MRHLQHFGADERRRQRSEPLTPKKRNPMAPPPLLSSTQRLLREALATKTAATSQSPLDNAAGARGCTPSAPPTHRTNAAAATRKSERASISALGKSADGL